MNYEQMIQQKKLKFQEPVPEELKCLLCHNVLINPHTVPCGHDYCLCCIQKHINNNSNPYCVGNNDECKEKKLDISKNVVPSFKIKNKLKNMKIYCFNSNCPEIIQVRNIEEHQATCMYRIISCPFDIVGCGVKEIAQNELQCHLKESTECHASTMKKYVEEIKNNNQNLKNEIDCLKHQVQNEVESKNGIIQKYEDELKKQTDENERNMNALMLELENEVKKVKDEHLKELTKLNNEKKENENKLKQENEQLQNSINKLKEFLIKTSSFDWIVEDFVWKYEAAPNNADFHIESEPQYLCGYNIVLLLYPRRKYCGDDWAGVRFKIVPGVCDEIVPWPCTRTIKLSAVTWYHCGLYSTQSVSDKDKDVYKKPVGDGNKLSAVLLLCTCSDIHNKSKHLLKRNKIKIKIWTE